MEHDRVKRALKPGWWILGGALLVGVSAVLLVVGKPGAAESVTGGGDAVRIPRDQRAPENVRVRVEILNGTTTRGLARRATFYLRDRGFDVVEMGNSATKIDTTLVIVRTGHPEWAEIIARSFLPAKVEIRPDSSRYLDVTVLLGRAWTPPAKPFYP